MKKILIILTLSFFFIPKSNSQCNSNTLYFDGADDYIDTSTNGAMSNIQNSTSYTIEAWVKRDIINNPNGLERIFSKDYIFQFRVADNKFTGEIGSKIIQSPYPSDTNWHHLAFIIDALNSNLRLYIDGVNVNTVSYLPVSIKNNGAMVCIGARNNNIGIYEEWKGNIKLIRVSNNARYNSNFTPLQNLNNDSSTLALYAIDEGINNNIIDKSGNNLNGVIHNAIWQQDTFFNITSSPKGNENQIFNIGDTLNNLIVTGENIVWYSSTTGNLVISENTVLENEVTYYASQTINGCESPLRLAVTVYADNTCQSLVINTGILSNNPVTYNNTVTIYPNPAKDHITIDCGNLANVSGWNIKITNMLGQEVFSQPMNTQQYVVPINTWLGQGVYFVKIYNAQGALVTTKKIILQ
jgi:hypothetical protein